MVGFIQIGSSFLHLVPYILTPIQIPKPDEKQGMSIGWPTQETDMDKLKALHEELKAKM